MVVLSDGKECNVRTLGLFELDTIPLPDTSPFTYEMETLSGDKYQVEFDISLFTEPPEKPEIAEHEIEEKSAAWYKLRTWQFYRAAIFRNREIVLSLEEYVDNVCAYILENSIDKADLHRIVTLDDWDKVYRAALIPQMTMELIEQTLRTVFQAKYDGEEIMEALGRSQGGKGSYAAIRMWEIQLMLHLSLLEKDYATLSLDERARKLCAMKLDDWIGYLEGERLRKEREIQSQAREVSRNTS